MHLCFLDFSDAQLDQSVFDQDDIAFFYIRGESAVLNRDDSFFVIAAASDAAGGNFDILAIFYLDAFFGHLSDADFWSLEVLENSDGFTSFFFGLANILHQFLMTFVISMRKIQPRYIHPSLRQGGNFLHRIGARTQSTDEFSVFTIHRFEVS